MTKKIFEITIKRVKGARSMRLKIGKNEQPILTLPYWIPQKMGLIWAQKQQEWIQKNTFIPKHFHSGQRILFLGQDVLIQHAEKHLQTHIEEGVLWVAGEEVFLPRRVADFIKKEFLIYLFPLIREKEQILGLKHKKVMVRDTSSRWGSCSSNGVLSFCWRLAMAPEFVIDYLVAHEVAHLKHMDHSRQFWKTVAQLSPHTYQAKKWLKENGRDLPVLK
ncbi:MAG: M48 family metallopeptidase [Alphaproteobacteria bacterium]